MSNRPFPAAERPFTLVHRNGERLRGMIQDRHGGPVGIYLPGFASTMDGNKSLLLAQNAQERGWSWVRFDPRGVGRSDGLFQALTLSRYLADLQLILGMLEQRTVVLVGSSMGGWLAVIAAGRWPARMAGLLLIAPAFNFIQQIYGGLSIPEQRQWRETGLRRWQDPYGLGEIAMQYDLVADSWRYDLLRFPPRLSCPVEILHGSADEAVPLRQSYQFAAVAQAPLLSVRPLIGAEHRLQGADAVLLRSLQGLWSHAAAEELPGIQP